MFNKKITIDGRSIGEGFPPYIIAELSANHNGDINRAFKTMEIAKEMGADAVKIQTYTPDTLTIDCDKEDFRIHGGLWDGENLYDLYARAYTPYEWHPALFEKARELGITLFSTPFDTTAIDLLETLNAPAYKIASFEMIDHALLRSVAKTGKLIIMSTGMATFEEIRESVSVLKDANCRDLIVLHCVSSYPTPIEQANIRTLSDISAQFDVLSGLSDHTLGVTASVAATVLGASVIEKHFTLDRSDKGPDAAFSLEPPELKQLCESTKAACMALGEAGYDHKPNEKPNVKFRRSLYVVQDIKQGDRFTPDNVRSIRPGYGLLPKFINQILGKTSTCDIERGTAISWDMVGSE